MKRELNYMNSNNIITIKNNETVKYITRSKVPKIINNTIQYNEIDNKENNSKKNKVIQKNNKNFVKDFVKDNVSKRKSIPLTLKRKVWAHWIGEDIGKSKCFCCKLSEITQMSFHCGHIIAVSKGGNTTCDNLKPICQSCNSSMGNMNMNNFIKKYGL